MTIDPASIPRIGKGFRLQWEDAQQAHVLLYPEGMVKLNGSAGQILTRCDGAMRVDAIVADLEKCFETVGLEGEVHAFLELAEKKRWVELIGPASPPGQVAEDRDGSSRQADGKFA